MMKHIHFSVHDNNGTEMTAYFLTSTPEFCECCTYLFAHKVMKVHMFKLHVIHFLVRTSLKIQFIV